ncbi:hypothetical protein Tco_1298298, partial [Tanacetum coccineum]
VQRIENKAKTQYEVDWNEVSRSIRGSISLVDPAGVRGTLYNNTGWAEMTKMTLTFALKRVRMA